MALHSQFFLPKFSLSVLWVSAETSFAQGTLRLDWLFLLDAPAACGPLLHVTELIYN